VKAHASAAAEFAHRLSTGEGGPGGYTHGALFGPEVAIAAGGDFLVDHGHESPLSG